MSLKHEAFVDRLAKVACTYPGAIEVMNKRGLCPRKGRQYRCRENGLVISEYTTST